MDPSLQMLLQMILQNQASMQAEMKEGFADLNSFKWKVIGGSAVLSGILSVCLIIFFN